MTNLRKCIVPGPDLDKITNKLGNKSTMYVDKTCMSYWYPRICDVVPCPETEIITTQIDLVELLDGNNPSGMDNFVNQLKTAINKIGLPIFLRTGQTSAKHSWSKSCCIIDTDNLIYHVCAIVEYSFMVDFLGLATNVWAVRRLLKTEPVFYSFQNMPITREFRYFVRDGKVEHRQPYWPPHAFEHYKKSEPNWEELLAEISHLDKETDEQLTKLTVKVGNQIAAHSQLSDEFWSVDWLWAEGQWWLTDMAEGYKSFKWDPNVEVK